MKHKKSPAGLQSSQGQKRVGLTSNWINEEPTGLNCQSLSKRGCGRLSPQARQGRGDKQAPLPCLYSYNSIENHNKTSLGKAESNIVHDYSDGRKIIRLPDGSEVVWGGLSTTQKKNAFSLVENVQYLIKKHGINNIGFLTLTFKDNVKDWREAQRRFNSLRTNLLKDLFPRWIVVVEPQRRGAVHFHLLVVVDQDIRTGFDFSALERRDYSSASPYLKGLWKTLRTSMSKYGFGRSELLPVKSTGEGISKYVGKYLEKGSLHRGEQFKGARMIRHSKGWKMASGRFSWVSPAATQWRALVGGMMAEMHSDDLAMMSKRHGKKWAFRLLSIVQAEGCPTPSEAHSKLDRTRKRKDLPVPIDREKEKLRWGSAPLV